jgi:hypothetical protein
MAQVRNALRLGPEKATPPCNYHATFACRNTKKYFVHLASAAALNFIPVNEIRTVTLSGAA